MISVAPFEVGLTARDLDTLLPFYVEILGFTIFSDLNVSPATSLGTGLSPTGYRIVRLETNLGNRIKLAQPVTPPEETAPAAFPMQRRGGPYITFIVDDLHGILDRLKSARAPILSDGIVEVRPGVQLMLATDPEGNFLEFVEYADLKSYAARAPR